MPTSARCLSFLGSTWNLISVGTEPKNSELRNTELLFFLTKIQIPFDDELPKQPEHQTFKPRAKSRKLWTIPKFTFGSKTWTSNPLFKPLKVPNFELLNNRG